MSAAAGPAPALAPPPPRTRRGFWRALLRQPGGTFGLLTLALLAGLALFAEQVAPFAPTRMGAGRRLVPPGARHLLGTDEFGRDVLSRIIHGARLTLEVGGVAVGISLTAGLLVGLLAAYAGGWLERLLMRGMDVLFSFTDTLIALATVAVLGPGLGNAMVAVGIAGIPFYARTCYAAAVVERGKPYFEAAAGSGAGPLRLLLGHMLPNVMPTMIVVSTLGISGAILSAAGLGFLGLGAQPPDPEWGAMLSGGRDFFSRAPWLMVSPGVAIAVVVLAFNLLGDALREAVDPRAPHA